MGFSARRLGRMGGQHLLIYLWSMACAWKLEYLEYHCMHLFGNLEEDGIDGVKARDEGKARRVSRRE